MHNSNKWSAQRVREWHEKQRWCVGCNFLPSYAVNFMDFWHEARFNTELISRELKLAQDTGLNAVRVNLNYLVWKHEGQAHLHRIDEFLNIATKYGLQVILVPFDDCQFSGAPPRYSKQLGPITGTHNSRAVGSPGREIVLDWQREKSLEAFLKTIIDRYKTDERILFWDLYNEPGNRMQFVDGQHSEFDLSLEKAALEFMEAIFEWAREINPSQPLTVGAWHLPYDWDHEQLAEDWNTEGALVSGKRPYAHEIDRRAIALSDIISFHGYVTKDQMEYLISRLKKFDRPLYITEWLARPAGSRIEEQLPLFKNENIGCFHWGLVNGATQTHLPWPFLGIEAGEWFHDLYYQNGESYRNEEIELFKSLQVEARN